MYFHVSHGDLDISFKSDGKHLQFVTILIFIQEATYQISSVSVEFLYDRHIHQKNYLVYYFQLIALLAIVFATTNVVHLGNDQLTHGTARTIMRSVSN
jgi:hypothetical protein